MPRSIALLVLCLLSGSGSLQAVDDAPLTRVAFGSCARPDLPQPIWDGVFETKPELFVFLGDIAYADTVDMEVMRSKYALAGNVPAFRKLKETCPILAIWDDRDYGRNDAGAEYPKKRESQQIFLDFFGVPQDDPRRTQEGVYFSRVIGPTGKRVQFILLDGRYFRSPLKTGTDLSEPGEGYRGRYVGNSDPTATMLGDAQWRWLGEQLKVPAELRVICSGVPVVADEHGFEGWGNFPLERQRLFRLIRDTSASGVVFLSGDRRLAEISKLPTDSIDGPGYPLFDLTSSSLNTPTVTPGKTGARYANELNSYRVGLTYFDVNFGLLQIDWTPPDPIVRLQIRDEAGAVVAQQRVALSQMKARGR